MIKKSLPFLLDLVLAACAPDAPEPGGTVIVNARVIDGSGGLVGVLLHFARTLWSRLMNARRPGDGE